MINLSTITAAAQTVINGAAISGLTVERGERINFDPGRCPWCGIYPDALTTSPFSMSGQNWKGTGSIQIVLQTASFVDDGQEASDALETLAAGVESALVANPTLGVQGVRIVGFNRDYRYIVFDDDGNGTIFMPQVIIRPQLEIRSQ